MPEKMRAVSLFSGALAGGFEIGFDRAGIETVLQCEIDPVAQSVLRRHWPDTERVSDVRDVGRESVSAVLSRQAANSVSQAAKGASGEAFVVRGVRECVLPSWRPQEGYARTATNAQHEDALRDELGGLRTAMVGTARALRHLPKCDGEAEDRPRPYDGGGTGPSVPPLQPSPRRGGGCDISQGGAGISLVYGGFPCQPFSVAGKRLGEADERDGWPEFRRIVSELRPKWVLAENVPGLLSVAGGRYFGRILSDLSELGYGVAWGVRDAQFFGVPQRRRRVFIVATCNPGGCAGAERAAQVLSLCESCGGNPETGGTPGQDLADGAGDSVARTLTDNNTRKQNGRGDGADNLIAPTISTALGHHGWAVGDQDLETLQPHASGVRRLTPLECERLMGWPDDWTRYDDNGNAISDSPRYRLCGNGVAAPVAEWIGHRLMAVDAMMQRAEAVA